MSRPLRIEYPGAWYHVMNRGRRLENVFADNKDYEIFIELLKDASEMWNVNITAYCLMPNHYHLLIQTPLGNISRTMRHINGVYTQRYNKKHGDDGQLFRGRYKSILVYGDRYLLQLVRYIHRNSLKVGLADSLNANPWSSHKGYISITEKWNWLYKDFVLALLSKRKKEWIKKYRQFVSISEDDEATRILEDKKWPSIWGLDSFLDWAKGNYYALKTDEDVSQSKALIPGYEEILKTVCGFYSIDEDDLYKAKQGVTNEPRNVSNYLIKRLRMETLTRLSHFKKTCNIINPLQVQVLQGRLTFCSGEVIACRKIQPVYLQQLVDKSNQTIRASLIVH